MHQLAGLNNNHPIDKEDVLVGIFIVQWKSPTKMCVLVAKWLEINIVLEVTNSALQCQP